MRYLIAFLCAVAMTASAQTLPHRPVRLVTNTVGGGNDFMARVVAPGLSASLGQPVVVDNRPGGVIPGGIVAKAAPDGTTLLVAGGTFWLGPLVQDETPYDVAVDFAPISLLGASPSILAVHPAVPAKSVKELIALAKARPGELNYASPPTGAIQHLGMELFKSMAGVNIVRVAYRGNGPALTDVIAGQVQVTFAIASAAPQIKAGKVRALAVTSAKRSVLFPELPTIAESGLPGFEATAMAGMFAPAKTPRAIVERLNQEAVKVLRQPEVKERMLNVGVEPVGSSPAQFAALIKSEVERMRKVIKGAGIKAE